MPVRLISELDEERFEIRKLEFFKNKKVGFASEEQNSGDAILGEIPVPSIDDINSQGEFLAKEICRSDFERFWHENVQSRT
jgi:hypothetical protein